MRNLRYRCRRNIDDVIVTSVIEQKQPRLAQG